MPNAILLDEHISFRFKQLDKFQAFSMVREISGASYEHDLENNHYLGFIPLTPENFDIINDYFVQQRIALSDCDIHITLNNAVQNPTKTIVIPTIVNRMLKYIDCQLSFSVNDK